ncbi:helix-turn-helix domain-containing protein [Acidobacteria bacterium AB60]|nr:helix-turn-helix domain-containing protein [Acidobacteria bacterium AB60]
MKMVGRRGVDINERKLTVQEFAPLVGRTPKSVRNWISQGKLNHLKIRGRVFIPESEVQNILDESYVPARDASDLYGRKARIQGVPGDSIARRDDTPVIVDSSKLFRTTPWVAEHIGVTPQLLEQLVRDGTIPSPCRLERQNAPSVMVWSEQDIERARRARSSVKDGRRLRTKITRNGSPVIGGGK